ncbi:MAG: hypothetical protein WKF82_07010 [Nocardioidaceae bacterium]
MVGRRARAQIAPASGYDNRLERGVSAVLSAVLSALLAATAACSPEAGNPLDVPGAIPEPRIGAPKPVDVCDLLPADEAARILDRRLEIVGAAYSPTRVATFRCDYGIRFGESDLSVELAAEPIAPDVFVSAYGEPAGGDPASIARLGDAAYLRTENDTSSVHVFAHGAIVSVRLRLDPALEVTRGATIEIARYAVQHLPRNPTLAETSTTSRCGGVAEAALAAAIGSRPTLASEMQSAGESVMCSWTSQPGAADVTVITDPARVQASRDGLDEEKLAHVTDKALGEAELAVSRLDSAGDLTVFVDDSTMVVQHVTPTAGFAEDTIETTAGELALAKSVLSTLP